MKILIASTCVAILASTGYFFYGEYAEAQQRALQAEAVASAKARLFELAEAKDHEREKVATFCNIVRRNPNVMTTANGAAWVDRACNVAGL